MLSILNVLSHSYNALLYHIPSLSIIKAHACLSGNINTPRVPPGDVRVVESFGISHVQALSHGVKHCLLYFM